MGNDCFSSTPNEYYRSYLQRVNVSELKDLWQTVKLYKIKKIYDSFSTTSQTEQKLNHIPYEKFLQIFPEFDRYEEIHKRRLFEIFDHENLGYLNWQNFYSTITICYFAPEQTLSVFMFMIFDESLAKSINQEQIRLLIDLNAFFIKKGQGQALELEPEGIFEELCGRKEAISIAEWVDNAKKYFDFSKYRRFFNVFREEKLEKELVSHFHEWNQLYHQETDKYISYVVSYKWFQTWKIYVEDSYGVLVNSNTLRQTMKSLKTRKTCKKLKTMKKIASSKTLKEIPTIKNDSKISKFHDQTVQRIRNIDLIHSNIGQRPRQIYNNVIEGEFEEVLKTQIVENRDYVLVSQKVWKSLREIYGGGPEFRRTGFDSIELFPKIVKIYSTLFRNQIDYSSEILRQVSGYLTVEQLLTRSLDISADTLKQKKIFYKTIGMIRWELIDQIDYMFSEMTSEVLIYLMYLDEQEAEQFRKSHSRVAKDMTEVNVGDYVKYSEKDSASKTAVYMGKNIEGKYIFHFPRQSYIYDKCLTESDAHKQCSMMGQELVVQDHKLKTKNDCDMKGICNSKGLGFINSTILNLFNNKKFKSFLSMITVRDEDESNILKMLSQKKRVDIRDIQDMVEIFLPDFQNFEISLSQEFIIEFLTELGSQIMEMTGKSSMIQEDYKVQISKTKKCLKCSTILEDTEEDYTLELPLSDNSQATYAVAFVPVCATTRPKEIKRYGIKLKQGATLKQLKDEFERVAEIDKTRTYVLTEVYSDKIIKNFNSVDPNTTLQKLKIREGDAIIAYQLYVNFDKFIQNHYSKSTELSPKDLRPDNFIDCLHSEKGWIFGKVCEVQYLPYTQQSLIKVLHKYSKNDQWEVRYDFCEQSVAKFPLKCFRNAQQYHLKLTQRYFNEATNEMQVCNMPLIVVLTNWMRWKEFHHLVYLQVKRFVAAKYDFHDEEDAQEGEGIVEQIRLASNKDLNSKSTKKIMSNSNAQKFREYPNGPNLPYKLNLVDADGRCAICFLFLKTQIFKGEGQTYCKGCNLSQSEPISWQIKVADIVVTVDWKSVDHMSRNIVKQHPSLINLMSNRTNLNQETLEQCLKNRMAPAVQEEELLCCNRPEQVQTTEKITRMPQVLPIYLSRIVIEQDGFKKINKNPVSFNESIKIQNQAYKLSGVTSIEGNNRNVKYKTYLRKDTKTQEWIEVDGQHTKLVKFNIVQSSCALVLYYQKDG